MAEERTLGVAASQRREEPWHGEKPSQEELRHRMEEARESISQTVEEIKETVAHKYEAVKDSLDWREQVKKRPVAWSLGAAGVGFVVGCGIAALVKGNGDSYRASERTQESLSASASYDADEDSKPGLVERFKQTSAYDRLTSEASSLGNRFVDELSKTANEVVLPVAVNSIRTWLEARLPTSDAPRKDSRPRSDRHAYEPVLERNQ